MTKLSANISACWNSRFQHSGLSARLLQGMLKHIKLSKEKFGKLCTC